MTSATGDVPCDKTIEKIKDNLKKILQAHGCLGISQLILRKFDTARFAFYGPTELNQRGGVDKVPKECNLHEYLDKTSRAARTIAGNQKKKKKKVPGAAAALQANLKTDLELGGNPFKTMQDLEYSDTTEIYNLDDVEHRRAFEAVRINAFTKEILNPTEALKQLRNLDIHMLLNVAQHSLLNFNLTEDQKKAIQALRVSRNAVVHSGKQPTISKLQNIQLLMTQALPLLNDEFLCEAIKQECTAALSVLDSNFVADELRAELISNSPDYCIYDRKFTIHNEGYRDTPHTISWLCDMVAGNSSSGNNLRLRVAGSPGSGRTHALLAVYQHWATPDSSLNKAFKVVLPLVDRYQLDAPEISSKSKQGVEYRIKKSLQQWAPKCVAEHGFKHLNNAMGGFSTSDTLVLVDQCNGYYAYSESWVGPCIETGFLEKSLTIDQDFIPDEQSVVKVNKSDEKPMGQMIAQLLPLAEMEPDDNVQCREYRTLYSQFQDRRLLTCPQALCIFKNVTSSVIENLELVVMRAVIEDGDEWVARKAAAFNKDLMIVVGNGAVVQAVTLDLKKELYRQAYDHILSGNRYYDVKSLPFLPSYLTGPIEGPLTFKSYLLAEYLAALHVLENADVAAWKWLKNTPRFKRVFKFVVQMWQEQDSFCQNKKLFSSYLSVLFGLHKYEHHTASKNTKEDWHKPRPIDWTLEKEGFLRPVEDTYFKQWGLLTHVYDASGGDPRVLKSLLDVLRQFDSWGIEWDRMSGLTTQSLQNIFRKLVASVQRDGVRREEQTKVLIRLSGSVGRPDDLPAVIEALQQLKDLPCQLKVTFYYNQKDPKYGSNDHLSLLLKQSLQRLVHSEMPILSYCGPFLLPAPSSLSECVSLSKLQEAHLTVYDRVTLAAFLEACPSCLRYLCLNVDLTKEPRGPQPSATLPTRAATPSPHCRVRLALRYHGSLEILSTFSIFPRIHVLRLHGFYPPDSRTAGRSIDQDLSDVKGLNVDCLFVKYVAECKRRDSFSSDAELITAELASVWHFELLRSLAQCLPSVSRLIVSRLPGGRSGSIPLLVKLLCAKLPYLQRLIFHDTVVSMYEACDALSCVDQSGQCSVSSGMSTNSAVCKPRLNQETRDRLAAVKPQGFELLFLNVCDLFPSNWSPNAAPNLGIIPDLDLSHPHTVEMQMGYYISQLLPRVTQISQCSLPLFCYEGHRACQRFVGEEWVHDGYHGPALQVLRSPTQDLRLHLHLNCITDEVVFIAAGPKESSEDALPSLLRALLPLFATAQYLKLRVGALSASGFLTLAGAVHSHKQQQLALQTAASSPPQVDPFTLTVVSVFDDVLISTKKPFKAAVGAPAGGASAGETGAVRRGGESGASKRLSGGGGALDSAGRLANDRANYFQMACETLEHSLKALPFLSYTLFEMVHASDTKKVLCSVKKTHGGQVLKSIAK